MLSLTFEHQSTDCSENSFRVFCSNFSVFDARANDILTRDEQQNLFNKNSFRLKKKQKLQIIQLVCKTTVSGSSRNQNSQPAINQYVFGYFCILNFYFECNETLAEAYSDIFGRIKFP